MRKAGGFSLSRLRRPDDLHQFLLILLEIIFLPENGLDCVVLMGEIGLEARAEVDVPPPDAAEHRFRILVVMRSELAVLAGILCHNRMFLTPDGTKVMLSL